MPKPRKKPIEDSYTVVAEDWCWTKYTIRSVHEYKKEGWPDSCFPFLLPDTESPETLLERSVRHGEYSAEVASIVVGDVPKMRKDTITNSFRTIPPTSPARCSNLLHSQPIPEWQAFNIFSSPVTALRFAQVWEQVHNQKKTRFGTQFRNLFHKQLNHLIVPEFGDPTSWLDTKLLALDWFFAVLARLLRRWHEAGYSLDVWKAMYKKDAEAIDHAASNQREIRLVGGADYRDDPFPWDRTKTASSRPVPGGHKSVLGSSVLSRIANQTSVRHAAETAAYLVFREFLSRVVLDGTEVGYCKLCCGIFLVIGNQKTFCSTSCGHEFYHRKSLRRLYLKRVDVAIKSLSSWISHQPPHIAWRAYLEQELVKRNTIKSPHSRKNPAVGAWILAADSERGSEQWIKPMSWWFSLGVGDTERDSAIRKFEQLYSLIRDAQVAF
jgi:hypothetical protein